MSRNFCSHTFAQVQVNCLNYNTCKYYYDVCFTLLLLFLIQNGTSKAILILSQLLFTVDQQILLSYFQLPINYMKIILYLIVSTSLNLTQKVIPSLILHIILFIRIYKHALYCQLQLFFLIFSKNFDYVYLCFLFP